MAIYNFKYADLNPADNILGLEVRKSPVDWMLNVCQQEKMKNINAIWYYQRKV